MLMAKFLETKLASNFLWENNLNILLKIHQKKEIK